MRLSASPGLADSRTGEVACSEARFAPRGKATNEVSAAIPPDKRSASDSFRISPLGPESVIDRTSGLGFWNASSENVSGRSIGAKMHAVYCLNKLLPALHVIPDIT